MLWHQLVILALIQGITEFLPISSSAHLILPAQLLSWPDQGLAFDVAVHLGTLLAVCSYFYQDIMRLLSAWLTTGWNFSGKANADSRLAWIIILATLPALLAGFLFNDLIATELRSIKVIAWTTIGFGLLLWLADRYGSRLKNEAQMRLSDGLLIGLAQALALIPGTSRSGITMTAARLLGFSRTAAARFSFLLSIPIILAASAYKLLELLTLEITVDWQAIIWGVLLSAASAYACIYLFLKWLSRLGFTPFLVYRLLLGAILLYIGYY